MVLNALSQGLAFIARDSIGSALEQDRFSEFLRVSKF